MRTLTVEDFLTAMLEQKRSIVFTGFRGGSGVVAQTKQFGLQLNYQLYEINCAVVDQRQFRAALSDVISAASNDDAKHLLLLTEFDTASSFVKRDAQQVLCYRTDANQLQNPENLQIICLSNQLRDFDLPALQRWTNICDLKES